MKEIGAGLSSRSRTTETRNGRSGDWGFGKLSLKNLTVVGNRVEPCFSQWLIRRFTLGLIRRFAQGSSGAPRAVVGFIEIKNHVHEPFPRTAVGGFP